MEYEAVIGLEVHAELLTQSKMFCACPVVDSTQAKPNTTVCPVCCGMPGMLPVINQQAVDYAIRVALALGCTVAHTSIFARKNYFYPDSPKGYQISQYEEPLAQFGLLRIHTAQGERDIRIRRVHLEEDTGKLTHVTNQPAQDPNGAAESYSLVDLNRAGVPLLEIVSEPDMHNIEEVRAYAEGLRAVLRTLGVNSGDMEKGVIRFEANVSVRPAGSTVLGTRVEIKNLNSFRALERSTTYQIEQQILQIEAGGSIVQETLGWDDVRGVTYSQRSKEEAHDYRYFPEPDLPPLIVEQQWIDQTAARLPEMPYPRARRFETQYALSRADANLLVEDKAIADYFETAALTAAEGAEKDGTGSETEVSPRLLANWITGEIFAWMNATGKPFSEVHVPPSQLAELAKLARREINFNTAKMVLAEMLENGKTPAQIIQERGLLQISDADFISGLVQQVLEQNASALSSYLAGKETLANWFFGQTMRAAGGRANPQVLRAELERQLDQQKRQAQ